MFRRYLFLILILTSLAIGGRTLAQAVPDVAARRAALETELKQVEAEIAVQNTLLTAKRRESSSIKRDLDILTAQIARAKLNIRAKQLEIERLGGAIGKKAVELVALEKRVGKHRDSLGELLRQTRVAGDLSVLELVLAKENWSQIFADGDNFNLLEQAIQDSLTTIREEEERTSDERTHLEGQREAELDAKAVIEAERKSIEKDEAEKKVLLGISKSQEKNYQTILNKRAARAAEIRTALFALRDTAAIPFGTALKFATSAQGKTGVRAAFLLAILTQESNLGENIGTCNRLTDPPAKHWRVIMKPERDHAPYLALTKALGLNPDTMPLSCPWQGGWGGAMGPSQFIPSTWALYANKISNLLGKSIANPWEPEDAFMASAVYLSELGADGGQYASEREAALRYYAGSNWNKAKNAFYGNQVMEKARDIQQNMIDVLQNS